MFRILFLFQMGTLLFGFEPSARAWSEKSLEIADPFVFRPNNMGLEHFTVQAEVPWRWVPGSFEWVRVDRKFLIPRARLILSVPPHTQIRMRGHRFQSATPEVDIPIVLYGEKGNELYVEGAKPSMVKVSFKPDESLDSPLILDSTCSGTPLKVMDVNLKHSWGQVYCHWVHPGQQQGLGNRLDVDVLWDTEEDGILHSLSFQKDTPRIQVKKGEDSFSLAADVSSRFHPFAVSMGLGPYSHRNELRPFSTLYASYLFNEVLKVASFTALPVKPNPEIDSGIYMIIEQFRGIDERVSLNLLLGAHVLGFQSEGEGHLKMSAPQGVEVSFRDFIWRTQNLMIGGFFYPEIANRYYVNTWLRFGNSKLFYEFNFINWQEPVNSTQTFVSKSAGISIGFPLFRAF